MHTHVYNHPLPPWHWNSIHLSTDVLIFLEHRGIFQYNLKCLSVNLSITVMNIQWKWEANAHINQKMQREYLSHVLSLSRAFKVFSWCAFIKSVLALMITHQLRGQNVIYPRPRLRFIYFCVCLFPLSAACAIRTWCDGSLRLERISNRKHSGFCVDHNDMQSSHPLWLVKFETFSAMTQWETVSLKASPDVRKHIPLVVSRRGWLKFARADFCQWLKRLSLRN